jgi:hypothetical protein
MLLEVPKGISRISRRSALVLLALPLLADDDKWLLTDADFRNSKKSAQAVPNPDAGARLSDAPRSKGMLIDVQSDNGPVVKVESPVANRISNPIDLKILFEPKDRPIDLKSLRLHASKEIAGQYWGDVDLVPRIRQYLTDRGIEATGYHLPKGRFRIALSIRDIGGNESSGQLILEVVA